MPDLFPEYHYSYKTRQKYNKIEKFWTSIKSDYSLRNKLVMWIKLWKLEKIVYEYI